MTLWLGFTLLTAVAFGVRDVSIKLYRDLTPYDIAALELAWSLPFLAAGLAVIPAPPLDATFWWTIAVAMPLELASYFLYLHAVKLSPLSLTAPFLAFTPFFMVATGFFILGERITLWGGIGMGLIVAGSYILNFSRTASGILHPWRALLHEPGSRLMLLVALLFAFAAVMGKKAILHSSPLFFGYAFTLAFSLLVLLILATSGRLRWQALAGNRTRGLWLALLSLVSVTFHCLAISQITAAYMIAAKRSSILVSVFLSWLILKEGNILARGVATLLMFGGILCITLLG
ncbi:MAG TPA: DMT family transporter [Desulfurivibrionaceae bacterium]|nr:DMT family transporter [Desulfurivibrionaceae bacterium]